jgi:PTS system fructose-specific IIA component
METISVKNISMNVAAKNQQEVFEQIAAKAFALGYTSDQAGVLAGLKAREAQGSTGVEAGFAIPHTLCPAIKDAAVIVLRLANDVEWETFDDGPVNFIISLLAPQGASAEHLKLLSTISSMLMHDDVQAKLKAAQQPEEIYSVFAEKLK